MTDWSPESVRRAVRDGYARIARRYRVRACTPAARHPVPPGDFSAL